MRIVLALGGNALLRRGEVPDAAIQRHHLRTAAPAIASIAAEHEVFIVHGNGPQVGLLANENEADTTLTRPYPLGDLVAESQGLIGSWIQQALLREGCDSVALVTQVLVDGGDPAFISPDKQIGPMYDEATAHQLAQQHGWTVKRDGAGWRRVVASPRPVCVLGLDSAAKIVRVGKPIILGGGGGVPLHTFQVKGLAHRQQDAVPVEAVIDKDHTAALVADNVSADLLIILTDVPGVMTGYGTFEQTLIDHATPGELRTLRFAAGSMQPKVTACSEFVQSQPDRRAAIGPLDSLAEILAGTAGTQISLASLSAQAI